MELRILSGLHRGGVLALDEGSGGVTLGASPQADVLLADAGVQPSHCRLLPQGAGWRIEPAQGRVFDAAGRALTTGVTLERGQVFRVADVWLGFHDEGDAWPEGVPAQAAAASAAAAPGLYPRVKGSLVAALLAVALLPGAVWLASSAWGKASRQLAAGPAGAASAVAAAAAASGPDGEVLSPAALAEEFTRGLAERELADRLQLNLQDDRWEIRGSLDSDEQQRFERLLVRFFQAHRPDFPIQVTLLSPAELLPFKVVEVISGKGAGVVTDTGERLAVGDAVQGYRLTSVEPGKAVFTGRQRVEVAL